MVVGRVLVPGETRPEKPVPVGEKWRGLDIVWGSEGSCGWGVPATTQVVVTERGRLALELRGL